MYIVDTRQSYIVCTVLSNPRLIILYCYRPNRVLKTNLRVYRRVPISIYLDKCKLFVVKFQKRIRKNDQTAHVCCLTCTPMSFNKICTTRFSNDVYIIFFLTRRLRSASHHRWLIKCYTQVPGLPHHWAHVGPLYFFLPEPIKFISKYQTKCFTK